MGDKVTPTLKERVEAVLHENLNGGNLYYPERAIIELIQIVKDEREGLREILSKEWPDHFAKIERQRIREKVESQIVQDGDSMHQAMNTGLDTIGSHYDSRIRALKWVLKAIDADS